MHNLEWQPCCPNEEQGPLYLLRLEIRFNIYIIFIQAGLE